MGADRSDSRGTGGPKVTCRHCKHRYSLEDTKSLVFSESKGEPGLTCPKCSNISSLSLREIGCADCRASYWVADEVMGRAAACPHCSGEACLPSDREWKQLAKDAREFQWIVLPGAGGEPIVLHGEASVAECIPNGRITANDAGIVHAFAPKRPVRELCDPHFRLRSLYDPVGAWGERIGAIVGVGFAGLYVVAHIVYGAAAGGDDYFKMVIFGILGVVTTPTVIGLGIVYFIARACEVSLLWAYIGVALAALIGVGVGFLGYGIGRGLTRVIGRQIGLGERAAVRWS